MDINNTNLPIYELKDKLEETEIELKSVKSASSMLFGMVGREITDVIGDYSLLFSECFEEDTDEKDEAKKILEHLIDIRNTLSMLESMK